MILEFIDERAHPADALIFNKHRAGYVVRAVQRVMGLDVPIALSLTIVEPERIRAVNRETRGVDAATDVLSFPMLDMPIKRTDIDPDTGAAFLGDILINAERVAEQALEYSNTLEREFSYLVAHGVLHLLGHDHMDEGEKRVMRDLEERALEAVDSVVGDLLYSKAKAAMKRAYAPYSHYAVGACLMGESGALYTGANVENASYGLTICAERAAVAKAVSMGETRFAAIAIAARGSVPYPCGACRQVMSEFAKDMRIIAGDADGDEVAETTLSCLMPHAFGPEHL